MLDRLFHEQARLAAGAFYSEHSDEGDLALIIVLAKLLADPAFVAAMVEQIVRDLEGEAEAMGIAAKARPRLGGRLSHDRPGFDAPADQCTRLEPLESGDGVEVERLGRE